jgi:GntR family transcriptional regulator, colanic acid and biofilm gene transcriptional regulator
MGRALADGSAAEPSGKPAVLEKLHEQIYVRLKHNIMTGRFAPGQKLPLRGLAETLGTSLIPVRDALQRLESIGGVVMTSNRTMMVPSLTTKEYHDISLLRVMLEGTAAEAAARLRTDAEIAVLAGYCEDTERSEAQGDVELFLEANYNFHMTIAQISRIAFIGNLLEALWLRVGPLVRQTTPNQADIRSAVRLHWRICKAIAAGNSALASEAVREDILTFLQNEAI